MRRIYGFAVLWLVLLIVLPIGWFGFALLAWLTALTPGLIEIHSQFQNEPCRVLNGCLCVTTLRGQDIGTPCL